MVAYKFNISLPVIWDDFPTNKITRFQQNLRARAFFPAIWRDALLVSSLKETAIPGENLVICLLMISSKLGGAGWRGPPPGGIFLILTFEIHKFL